MMKDRPLVSLAINNYNYERFLKEAIDSALQQTYSPIEVIVVDDGSTDNSREVIASYGDKIIPVFKENGGQASAFNAGFAASKGEIICFLDADDLFLPEKVAIMIDSLGDRQDLGWCFHTLQWWDMNAGDYQHQILNNGKPEEWDLRESIARGKFKPIIEPFPSTSGLCFRRSHLEKILPMPEAKGISLNDGYLEFVSLGLSKGLILDRQLAIYRIHGTNAFVKKDSEKQKGKIKVILATGYWMRKEFPQFSKYADNLIAAGMGIAARHGGILPESQPFVKEHLASVTLLERFAIYIKAAYVYWKNPKD